MSLELRVDTTLARRLQACLDGLSNLSGPKSHQYAPWPGLGSVFALPKAPLLDILVIDDDLDTRILLERVGTAAGYAVDHAPNAATGLEMAVAAAPRLVLLDIHMPDSDGRIVAEQLCMLPAPQRPAILLMTADLDLLTADSSMPVIAKPFDLAVLLTRFATLLAVPRA